MIDSAHSRYLSRECSLIKSTYLCWDPHAKNIKSQEVGMGKKPQYHPSQNELDTVLLPACFKSPNGSSRAEGSNEGVGQGYQVAEDNDPVGIEALIDFESSVKPVDHAKVEELLNKD